MGNDDHCHSTLPAHILQKLQDCLTSLVVQCTCRLITQQQLGILRQCPGNGNSLLLTTGKLCREIGQSVLQSHFLQNLPGIQRIFTDLQCQFYVLQRCKIRHQIIELEYKSNIISPITGKLPAVISGNIPSIHQNFSAGSLIHTPKNVQHCRLARTAGTNDHYELSLGNLKADLIHCNDLYFFGSIYLGNLIQFYICICHLTHPHFPCNFIFATPVILFCYNY